MLGHLRQQNQLVKPFGFLIGASGGSISSRGLDGITYEFGVFVLGYGYLRAEAWSPQQGKPRKMADITYLLKEFCEQKNGEKYLKKIEAILK